MINYTVSIASIFGWLGAMLYLLSHSYISYKADWNKRLYYAGNLIAAMLLIATSVVFNSWQAVVINCFWAVVSLLLLCDVKLRSLPVSPLMFRAAMVILWGWIALLWFKDGDVNLGLLGWSSAFAFSAAYLLFSVERMRPGHYFLWSAYAALALLPQLWLEQNWPVFVLEIIWAGISLFGAIRSFGQFRLID
jgi:hypothetical protein